MDIIKDGVVKIRKDHECWGCRTPIASGSMTRRLVSVDGGKIGTCYWCPTCEAVLKAIAPDAYEDGLVKGELTVVERELWAEIKAGG